MIGMLILTVKLSKETQYSSLVRASHRLRDVYLLQEGTLIALHGIFQETLDSTLVIAFRNSKLTVEILGYLEETIVNT